MPEDADLPSPGTEVLGLEDEFTEEELDPRAKRRISRRKPRIIKGEEMREEILDHILKTMHDDEDARQEWIEMRLERYAKLRGWRGTKDFPWAGASNVHLPMTQIDNLRTQDTLVNAVMAVRPPVNAKATKRTDAPKQETVDDLMDYQIFIEDDGEDAFAHIIQKFVEDGRFTAYIPWVRETKNVHDVKILPPLDDEADDQEAIRTLVEEGTIIKNVVEATQTDDEGYEWEVIFTDSEGMSHKGEISVYFQENDRLEAHIAMPVKCFDGPKIFPKNIEDVVAPWRCGNLQPPGPSNPHGAPHVRLLDYPGLDEILGLHDDGWYGELSEDDIDRLKGHQVVKPDNSNSEEMKTQIDEMEGVETSTSIDGKKVFKRIMSFDRWDVNGDGLMEDVIFWMIEEPKVMLKAVMLTEQFPIIPPRRPLAEAQFIPVAPDRLYGISLPELSEPLHDILVTTVNQIIDNSTIANTPFFFFRPGTGMRSDIIRVAPGEGIPLHNPQQDVHFPVIQGKGQSEGFNLATIVQQYEERLTMVSDLDLGRVPKGSSQALRTASGMSAVLQQGEARPERILRRLFTGIRQIYEIIHALNMRFLPARKHYRITGYVEPDRNPYGQVDDIEQIRGEFNWEFQAALTNISPAALEQSLGKVASLLLNPISLQMGMAKPDGVFNLMRDIVKTLKIDPDRYFARPQNADVDRQKITAQEAISVILNESKPPDGVPLEGTQRHFDGLVAFAQSDDLGLFDEKQTQILRAYMASVNQRLEQEKVQLQRVMAAAEAQRNGASRPNEGLPPAGPNPTGVEGNPRVGTNELLDESLPGAGGGANGAGP